MEGTNDRSSFARLNNKARSAGDSCTISRLLEFFLRRGLRIGFEFRKLWHPNLIFSMVYIITL
jgi:hypothetical protein